MKVITIIGARPQFIKAAVVSRAFRRYSSIEEQILHTGQHFDPNMSDVFFTEMDIPNPQFNLGVGGGTHGENTGRMLEKIELVLLQESPDLVLVYGDTDSTLAGALAAAKLHIPVAHVEAGLRSFNKKMPEEINRILTDQLSDHLFAPTATAVANLATAGFAADKIIEVGDVMYDAVLYYGSKAALTSRVLLERSLQHRQFILATIHRAENADNPLRLQSIIAGLQSSRLPVIWPMHPRTRLQLKKFGIVLPSNIIPIDPVGYLEMAWLEKNASAIATDSGGVQKEAYFYSVPCITLRDETEWIELVDCGANVLTGANTEAISSAIQQSTKIDTSVFANRFYGNGSASNQIADFISKI